MPLAPPPEPPPDIRPRTLLAAIRETIRRLHYSPRTEDAYVQWTRAFIAFHGGRHPRALGAPEMTAFLNHLAVERRVSASTQNQALCAQLADPLPRLAVAPKTPGRRSSTAPELDLGELGSIARRFRLGGRLRGWLGALGDAAHDGVDTPRDRCRAPRPRSRAPRRRSRVPLPRCRAPLQRCRAPWQRCRPALCGRRLRLALFLI